MEDDKSNIESNHKRIIHLKQVLKTIRYVNQLINREKVPKILAQKICDVLVDNRGYFNACIILTDRDEQFSFIAGPTKKPEYQKLEEQILAGNWPSCCRDALDKNELVIYQNPVKECKGCVIANQHENHGVFAIRLEAENHLLGIFIASISRPYLYDDEEQELFRELAADISFGFNINRLEEHHDNTRKKLQKNESFLYHLAEISPVGIVKTDEDGKVDYINQRAETIFNYKKDEITGKSSLFEDINIQDYEGNPVSYEELPFHKARKTGKSVFNEQCCYYIQDDSPKHLSLNSTPLFSDDNTFEGVITVVEDVTKMYQQQKENSDVKKELENTLSGLPVHIFRYKKDNHGHLLVSFSEGSIAKHHQFDTQHIKEEYLENIIGKKNYVNLETQFYKAFNGDWVDYELFFFNSWMKTQLKPYKYNSQDEVVEVIGYSIDVTAQKEAETKLEQESQLRKLLMELSTSFINLPINQTDEAINNALERLGQFVNADRLYIFNYDFENKITYNTYEWCNKGIEPQIDNLQNVSLDSIQKWVNTHVQGKPMYIADVEQLQDNNLYQLLASQDIKSLLTIPIIKENQCIGFVGYDFVREHHYFSNEEQQLLSVFSEILVNLYLRIEAEQEVKKFKTIADHANYGMGIIGMNGKVMYINYYFASLLGYSPDELYGHFLENILSKEQMVKIKPLFENLKETGSITSVELWLNDRYGKSIPLLINSLLIEGNDYQPSFATTTAIDISGQKEKEEELIQAKEKAEESDHLKSVFLANLSHEIRTPMNGILGFMEVLNNPELPEVEQQEYMESVKESGQRLLETFDNLMEISKIETGEIKLRNEEIEINTLMEQLFASYKNKVKDKEIEFNIQKAYPETKLFLYTDREKLNRVLKRLLQNAIKFTNQGHIELGYSWKNGKIEFFIKDTGIGIARDKLNLVFDNFVQADFNLSRSHEGLGLGLSITKAYVEKLGGEINVDSEINKGTIFYVSLPENKNA